MIPDSPMTSSFAQRWDKRDDWTPRQECDEGWIGEDVNGIWSKIHPLTAFSQMPEVWDTVTEFQMGQTKLTTRDFHTKSAFEYACKLAMKCAQQREESRQMKRGSDDGQEG